MKKTITIPKQMFRTATFDKAAVDETARTVEMSISGEEPYERWFGNEILDHSLSSVRMDRLKAGAPLLFNHNRDAHIGRIISATTDGKNLRIKAQFGNSALAQEKFQDVKDGILRETSVGYQVNRMVLESEDKDAGDTYRVTDWTPYEGSLVTIPADASVGVGRSDDSDSKTIFVEMKNNIDESNESGNNTHKQSKSMTTKETEASPEKTAEVKVDIGAERAAGRADYKNRCKKITDYVAGLKNDQWREAAQKIAEKHIANDEPDFTDFREEAITHFDGVKRLDAEQANPKVGIDWRSVQKFSVVKAIREMSDPKGQLTGLEKEVCEFAAKQYEKKDGRHFEGACIPSDITEARAAEVYDLNSKGMDNLAWEVNRLNQQLGRRTMAATNFTGGGFLVGQELLSGSYIDLLRNACFIGQGLFGIIELNGLVGNIAIPKQTTTATTYWLPEGGSTTASDFAGSQLYFTPHRLSCLTQFTKQLLMQSTPSIEMLVRNDQAMAVGVEEDRVVYGGSGSAGEPLGIINTTGVGADVTFSGNWTWAKTLLFESSLENANVRLIGEPVFVTNPTTKGYAKATPQVASSTFPIFIWMPSKGEFPTIAGVKGGIVNEYGAYATKQVAANVLFGIFNNNVCKARWGGFDLMVEPYTGAATETIKSYLNEWIDVGVRYPQAFEYSTDAPTSP